MAVSDAMMQNTSGAAFVSELWSTGAIEAVQYASVFQNRVNRGYEKQLKVGDILNIPNMANLNTQDRQFGTPAITTDDIKFESITEATETITVNKHQYAAFLLDSVLQVQANQDLMKGYQQKIGYAIARGTEVNLAALVAGYSTNVVGTLGVEMTIDDWLSVYQKLGERGLLEDSPTPGSDYSLILGPAAYTALLKIDEFINRQYKTDGDAMARARVGEILGMEVYRSNLVTSNGAGHDCVALHKSGMALIVQEEVPVISQYMIRYLSDGVVGWRLFGSTRVAFPPEATTSGGPSSYTAAEDRAVYVKTV